MKSENNNEGVNTYQGGKRNRRTRAFQRLEAQLKTKTKISKEGGAGTFNRT